MTRYTAHRLGIFRALTLLTLATSVSFLHARPAEAKLNAGDRAVLTVMLEGVFESAPSAASLSCISNRLPAGAMTNVIVDAAAAGDDTAALADSIAFRKFFRAVLLCKPREMVAPFAEELVSSGLTSKQRMCVASGFIVRMGTDDVLLTAVIRSGLSGLEFGAADDAVKATATRNMIIAVKPCVPRAQSDLVAAILENL